MAKSRKSAEPETTESSEPRSKTGSQPSSSAEIPRERIAERAYELYLARGATDGRDWEDWLIAEREVIGRRPPGDA